MIRERSVRPDVTHDVIGVQDERKTSRSQEIDVDSFHEEIVSSERTGRPVVGTNTEIVPDSSQTRSCHERETFKLETKTLRESTVRPVVVLDVGHEQTMLMEMNTDFRIPGLPHSVVKN